MVGGMRRGGANYTTGVQERSINRSSGATQLAAGWQGHVRILPSGVFWLSALLTHGAGELCLCQGGGAAWALGDRLVLQSCCEASRGLVSLLGDHSTLVGGAGGEFDGVDMVVAEVPATGKGCCGW